MAFHLIDMEKWERREHYHYYRDLLKVRYNLNVNVDITELLAQVKEQKLKFYPVFIDWEEFGKWEAMKYRKPQTMIMSFDDYVAMVVEKGRGSGIVINPFSDNLLLDREMMAHLKQQKQLADQGHVDYRVPEKTSVKLGEPANYPQDMVQAICAYAKSKKTIQALWLRLMEKAGEWSYLLVVDFSGDRQSIFDEIAKVARPYLNKMYLDMVPLESEFGHKATDGIKPIYSKKRGLFR